MASSSPPMPPAAPSAALTEDTGVSSEAINVWSFPPGFGFHPTDYELVSHYLRKKILHQKVAFEIPHLDIYKHDPWDLPAQCNIQTRDNKWHFFATRDRKYPKSSRAHRATKEGYWKSTGQDRIIKDRNRIIGKKKSLVFHLGRPPSGKRTEWIMHEFYFDEECKNAPEMKDSYVLCRVTKRDGWPSEIWPQPSQNFIVPSPTISQDDLFKVVDGTLLDPIFELPSLGHETEATSCPYAVAKLELDGNLENDVDETNFLLLEDINSIFANVDDLCKPAIGESVSLAHHNPVAPASFLHRNEHFDEQNLKEEQIAGYSLLSNEMPYASASGSSNGPSNAMYREDTFSVDNDEDTGIVIRERIEMPSEMSWNLYGRAKLHISAISVNNGGHFESERECSSTSESEEEMKEQHLKIELSAPSSGPHHKRRVSGWLSAEVCRASSFPGLNLLLVCGCIVGILAILLFFLLPAAGRVFLRGHASSDGLLFLEL